MKGCSDLKVFSGADIKNVMLVGHAGSGKTTLAEAMLYLSGATDRLGKTSEGNTVMDFDPEEKKRQATVSTSVAYFERKGKKINLIDSPGLFDFEGGICEAMRAADTVLIVLSGKSGVNVGSLKAYKMAKAAGKAIIVYISKLNSDSADYFKVLNDVKEKFGPSACPVVVPQLKNEKADSYVNLITGKAYKYDENGKADETEESGVLEEYRPQMYEAVAGSDEELMEKYFGGEEFTEQEVLSGLAGGTLHGDIVPVLCGSGQTLACVDLLLDALADIAPSAADMPAEKAEVNGAEKELLCDDNGPLAAVVFKTVADPFIGRLSYFKVLSGKLTASSKTVNARTGAPERFAKISIPFGIKQIDVSELCAGDIGVFSKLADVKTGDTICEQGQKVILKGVDFPPSCLSMAIWPKNKGDEEKIVSGIQRLMEEDPTIGYENNQETRELIVKGLGEQHLDVVVSRLKSKFGVDVTMTVPKVAYRETIRKKVKVQGRHKKQSGGHGQFGDVWIEFEPCDSDSLIFEEKIFGGAVPKNFFPAVEKGLTESMMRGTLAGYPVVGVKATLVDGSYHPVDSSEMSFKLAAALAFKNGIPQASPVLLEPIGSLKVILPDENMGDIMGEINKRRGRVLGMNPDEDRMQIVEAEIPMAETGDFATLLRSMTAGRGSFTLKFERYEEVPANIAQKVISESNADENEAK